MTESAISACVRAGGRSPHEAILQLDLDNPSDSHLAPPSNRRAGCSGLISEWPLTGTFPGGPLACGMVGR